MNAGMDVRTQDAKFIYGSRRFHVGPPASNPLVATARASFTEQANTFSMEWDESLFREPGAEPWRAHLEDVISRSQREVDRCPLSARIQINHGLALLNSGQLEEAIRAFDKALELNPKAYLAAVNLARVKVMQGKLDEAGNIYAGLQRTYPDDQTLLISRAYIALRRERPKEAVSLLKKIIKLDKDGPLPRYYMAISLLSLGKPGEAISHLRAATKHSVRIPELYHALGLAYAFAGDPKRSVRSFKIALVLKPDFKEAVHGLANVFLKQERSEEVIQLLSSYLAQDSEDISGRELLALAFKESKQYSAARAQLLRIYMLIGRTDEDKADRTRLMNNIGVCSAFLSDYENAKRWLSDSIELDPKEDAISYTNLARVYFETGAVEKALRVLQECKNEFPEDQGVRLIISAILARQGHYDSAIEELKDVAKKDAEAGVYASLGWLYSDGKQDLDTALKVLKRGNKRHPENWIILNNLAYVCLLRGDVEAARSALGLMPETLKTEVFPLATRGLLRLWEGDLEGGRRLYEEAERTARQQGRHNLVRRVRQKKHLEIARAYTRKSSYHEAMAEIHRGLSVKRGAELYGRDLRMLEASTRKQIAPLDD